MSQPSRGAWRAPDQSDLQFTNSVHDLHAPTTTAKGTMEYTVKPEPCNLFNLLERLANGTLIADRRDHYVSLKDRGITFYEGSPDVNATDRIGTFLNYEQLYKEAKKRVMNLRMVLKGLSKKPNMQQNNVVLIHMDNYKETTIWFWAVVAAGCIPCISLPFKELPEHRNRYIDHIRKLLNNPIILTNVSQVQLFPPQQDKNMNLFLTDLVMAMKREPDAVHVYPGVNRELGEIAMLMLTSGSTGDPKAVALTHRMVTTSVREKANFHKNTYRDIFLGWTDLSHVANLIEIHLQAVHLGANQIMVQSSDIVTNPLNLIEFVNRHRVSYTFAPNFLLTSLVKALKGKKRVSYPDLLAERTSNISIKEATYTVTRQKTMAELMAAHRTEAARELNIDVEQSAPKLWELGCLRALISGGESNVVETVFKLTDMLQEFNAPAAFIRPGFGMTETCAGCTYSLSCPTTDLAGSLEFACVGRPIGLVQLRIAKDGVEADHNEVGHLQIKGPVVFEEYYNDPNATKEVFTKDGWFITGDLARIEKGGGLHIEGRTKDVLCIYGVNHYAHAVEQALEDAKIKGMKPSFTVVFSHRPLHGAEKVEGTECMIVVYTPTYDHDDVQGRIDTVIAISSTIIRVTGVRPYRIIPIPENLLVKSVLGKLSRSQIKTAYEKGEYIPYEDDDDAIIDKYSKSGAKPETNTQRGVCLSFMQVFSTGITDLSIDANLFQLGVSSVDLFKLRVQIMRNFRLSAFPLNYFFTYPTIRELAAALDTLKEPKPYDPIVVLAPVTSKTTKTPIFFIHPGMGEVLIFMNLARYFTDRPIYALRARGFDGEPLFTSINEMTDTYLQAVKRTQPNGPYALVGYSFGSMIAFEITKRLQAAGDEVKFLATFDQPPFFKERARSYDWYECCVSVAFFLGLIEEGVAREDLPKLRKHEQERVLKHLIASAPRARLTELGMDVQKLKRWADLALGLKELCWDYNPAGKVQHMDAFWTVPLLGLVKAKSTEEWRNDFIGRWSLLVEKPEYHFVGGSHRTMISPPNLKSFVKKFKKVLEGRGL